MQVTSVDFLDRATELAKYFSVAFSLHYSSATETWDAVFDGIAKEEFWDCQNKATPREAVEGAIEKMLSSIAPIGKTYREMYADRKTP